jgi:hypothetical protein
MGVGITEKLLKHLYVNRGLSDAEIASFVGLDRTAIVRMRNSFEIVARKSLGEVGEEYVEEKLRELGHDVRNMNGHSKTSIFDLLADGGTRIEVKTAKNTNGSFVFSLSNKEECNQIESDYRIRLTNGRTRKLYRKTCDFIVCVGIKNNTFYPYIIPSSEINDKLQGIRISPSINTKYAHYYQQWDQIKKPDVGASDPK